MFRDHLFRTVEGLTSEQVARMESHFELLRRWNRKLNLTRVDSEQEAAERHYGESVVLARRLPLGRLRIVDIGSGGGFPGIPVAIVRSECTVILAESHQRKAVFLREATRDLANVRVLSGRAEDLAETFDWAISRAVAWADLSGFVFRLAPKVALLSGDLDLPFAAREPLPWGNHRFLTIVSRET